MPIHNLGYREWDGERLSGGSRWSVICSVGIRRAWQSAWLRRIAFVVWAPPLIFAVLVFGFEQILASPNSDMALRQIVSATRWFNILPADVVVALEQIAERLQDPSDETRLSIRPIFWKSVLLQLQRSQCIGLVFVVSLIAPPLISQDVRSRAFLLYFSRPLTRFQYIMGKFATVASFLLLTCTLPQLLLYVFAVLLSPDISVVAYTWDLPFRSLVASSTMIIPTTMLALMLSSLTTETRFATFGWFIIWIFGLITYLTVLGLSDGTPGVQRLSFLFLLFNDLSTWILGIENDLQMSGLTPHVDMQFAFVLGLTAICAAVVYRRVSAPLSA